jgi:peroxiredoxin
MTAEPARPNAGDPAPRFTATAVGGKYGTGQIVRLEDFRSRPVVLYFYPKDDTPDAPRKRADCATPGANSTVARRFSG